MKSQGVEEVAKLDSTLAEIKTLKRELHESQCKVVSLTKKVETLSNHQKLTSEALEKAKLELTSPRIQPILYGLEKVLCAGGRYGQG